MTREIDHTWHWWAGSSPDRFEIGPLDDRDAAAQEALGQGYFDDLDLGNGQWVRRVYVAECEGLNYDCDECGVVAEPCAGCCSYLTADELAMTFSATRNEGHVDFECED